MEPILQSVGQTVVQDVRELVHATQLRSPELIERDPPQWHWHVPLGFISLLAAGTMLIAAGGVQSRVQGRHAHRKTHMHKRQLKLLPPRPRPD